MNGTKNILQRCSFEELIREVLNRDEYHASARDWVNLKSSEGVIGSVPTASRLNSLLEIRNLNGEALSGINTRKIKEEIQFRIFVGATILSGVPGNDGVDNRENYKDIKKPEVERNFRCVAIVTPKKYVTPDGDGYSTLKTRNYGEAYELCPLERFRDQPILRGISFTGFLVAEDIIATAYHATPMMNVAVEDLRIVFGFRESHPSTVITRISNDNVYHGAKLFKNKNEDFAFIKLDRKVDGNQVIAELSDSKIPDSQPVYIIGHSFSLPLKYAADANVCNNSNIAYFTASLDAYSRNSGSPVFNAVTHKVEGMLVNTTTDIELSLKNSCKLIKGHPGGCDKQGVLKKPEVTRVSVLIDGLCKLLKESKEELPAYCNGT